MNSKYIIITPAKNEEKNIELTIKSVISQTIQPIRWVIISQGSTDQTEEIVQKYDKKYEFIQLIRLPGKEHRDFESKVNAFDIGFKEIKDLDYEYLGNLDADVSFAPYYYEKIIYFLQRDSSLGIAGGLIYELYDNKFVAQDIQMDSVPGAIQFFRRKCYEDIGGYRPLKYGGIDAAAEIMARMHGWKVQPFREIEVYHHRRVGYGMGNILYTRFRQGRNHYLLGYHPLFQILKCAYRVKDKPYILGGILTLIGYLWSLINGKSYAVSDEVVKYIRSEQMGKLKQSVKSLFF